MIQELKQYFAASFEPALIEEMNRVGTFMEVPEGADLIKPGQYIRSIPLLLEGSIKILRPDAEGEELLLYHLERGETCAMSMTCCLSDVRSEIHAVAETDVRLLMIPVSKMEYWSSKYKSWRHFVMDSYHIRLMELLESIDNIAFNNMDTRLMHYLEEKVKILNNTHIDITHKEIAADLHTSRVVVSRLLKKMENDGVIRLHRSAIEML
ncbi:Crp/Fnr family transcriptional regulator [Altibacter sp. HG106]|uniref:Crp/Fnr family transcriptional regulator n=1 Tax=Altibacter sp. HG106 TaxID=3023937 RepID=UPI002350309F|nr:Crp/Fnr family transcriptional regulator [Altibacter sp. HG106]MDC7995500.1 Crp/Fnr family transcriptional regulator [Altibacter sp. HG106]